MIFQNSKKGNKMMGFVGITPATTKEQLIRALLEGYAFTIGEMILKYKTICDNVKNIG